MKAKARRTTVKDTLRSLRMENQALKAELRRLEAAMGTRPVGALDYRVSAGRLLRDARR